MVFQINDRVTPATSRDSRIGVIVEVDQKENRYRVFWGDKRTWMAGKALRKLDAQEIETGVLTR